MRAFDERLRQRARTRTREHAATACRSCRWPLRDGGKGRPPKFALTRKRKAFAHLTLPANQAGEIAANALGGAYDAHDQAMMGLVPPAERKTSYPFVRITGLGLGPCTIEDHACLVVRVGASELGLAFPKQKLKQFAQWLAAAESLI